MLPSITNEPVRAYPPASPERSATEQALTELSSIKAEIPLVIGGREVRTGKIGQAIMPHRHAHVLADVHQAGVKEVEAAIDAALVASHDWAARLWTERLAILLKAAD